MEDYKKCSLEKLFDRYKGQPVEILTSDGVRYCGIDLNPTGDSVEIIDKCKRVVFIPYAHIDAVIEPMMKLTRFCEDDDCDCDDDDCDCGRNGNGKGNGNRNGNGYENGNRNGNGYENGNRNGNGYENGRKDRYDRDDD